MSVYDKDLFGKSKYEMAIERIRTYCKDKKVLVAFSGGKDSQCCYHLCKDAGIDFVAQYSVTRFEPPELIQFIRANYPDVVFRRAYKTSLVKEIEKTGLPNRWMRWCCNYKHCKTEGFDIAVIGVRWEESVRRRDSWRMFGQKQDRTFYICPICDWTFEDVWSYLNENKIPHCKLYDEGYKRIGCVCCPLCPGKGDEYRWPKFANVLRIGFHRRIEFANSGKIKSEKTIRILNSLPEKVAFDNWLRTGSTVGKEPTEDMQCVFAGSGFSESDGLEAQEDD